MPMMTPRVLVLLASYNGASWIEAQLRSILSQLEVQVVVRVSDDCSTDATANIVRALAAGRTNVELTVRASASGSAGANFKGLLADAPLEEFDYLALADQDDIWALDHLSRACRALRADPLAGGYSCAVTTFGVGEAAVLAQHPRIRSLDFLFEGAGQGCTFVLPMVTARRVRDVCRNHATLAATLHYHDWLIYLVARCSGAGWIFDFHPSLHYRQHGANEIGARSGGGAIRRRLDLIRQGWYAAQVTAALALASALVPGVIDIEQFRVLFKSSRSLRRRFALARLLLLAGRRRLSDRFVLACSAIAGWL